MRFLAHAFICIFTAQLALAKMGQDSATEDRWMKWVKKTPSTKGYVRPSKASPNQTPQIAEADHTLKGRRLQSLIRQVIPNTSFTGKEADQLVGFIESVKSLPPSEHQYSTYYHKEPGQLRFPVQIYADGSVYIHLLGEDQGMRKGGYKTFSRSINYAQEKLVANLVTTVRNQKQLSNILAELAAVRTLDEAGLVAKVFHYDLYAGKYRGEEKSKNAFEYRLVYQGELFEGDLRDLQLSFGESRAHLFGLLVERVHRMHELGWVHRDIKAGNFFFRRDQTGNLIVTMADFGFARPEGDARFGRGLSGSRGYIPPEYCLEYNREKRSFSSLSEGILGDSFSLGVMLDRQLHGKKGKLRKALYELNVAALPPKGKPHRSLAELEELFARYRKLYQERVQSVALKEASPRQQLSAVALELMHPDADSRPTLSEVLNRVQMARPDNTGNANWASAAGE